MKRSTCITVLMSMLACRFPPMCSAFLVQKPSSIQAKGSVRQPAVYLSPSTLGTNTKRGSSATSQLFMGKHDKGHKKKKHTKHKKHHKKKKNKKRKNKHWKRNWSNLPDSAQRAAGVLGYTAQSWDEDDDVPYDTKDFCDTTLNERQAALYLGLPPLRTKLRHTSWSSLERPTQRLAEELGWSEDKWGDEDPGQRWKMKGLMCQYWWWKDMTGRQRQAARHFGYSRVTWDNTGEDIFSLIPVPEDDEEKGDDADSMTSTSQADEEGDVSYEEEEDGDEEIEAAMEEEEDEEVVADDHDEEDEQDDEEDLAPERIQKPETDKKKFAVSRFFGGEGGTTFDHRSHPTGVGKLLIRHGSVIDGLVVTYADGEVLSAGGDGGESTGFILAEGEVITQLDVREGHKVCQEITLYTNLGTVYGPWGGTGRRFKDRKGEVRTIKAPDGMALCGILGREGDVIDALAFRWGDIADMTS